jgi:hypothetical protein
MRREKGSVLLLVTIALTAVMGIVGLAMDAGQLYVTKQQAQAAADAAVLAGSMDMFNTTGFDAAGAGFTGASISCTAGSTQSPCVYARLNGFSPPDTVTIKFTGCSAPPGVPVTESPFGPTGLICATVSRVVNTTFLRVLGTTTSTVSATASAAIIGGSVPTPIVITDPSLSVAFDTGGGAGIVICGGPSTGMQINSGSPTAVPSDASVDLRKAGTADDGNCTTGTGSDFRVVGNSPDPVGVNVGTTGHYSPGVSAVADPLASVATPAAPAAAPATTTINVTGTNGCPAAPCTLYSPGLYASGINVTSNALFKPGIYYMSSGGFTGGAGGCMAMATGFTDATTGWTGNMLVYNTGGGAFGTAAGFGSSCAANALTGSPASSAYRGILFFQDRSSAQTTHNFSGAGSFTLNGTIYITNSTNDSATQYQTVNLNGGSTITVLGEVVVSNLTMSGGSNLKIKLSAGPAGVKRVALVQ